MKKKMIDFKTKYRQYKISHILGEEFIDKDFLKMIDHIKSTIINPDFKSFLDDNYPDKVWYGLTKKCVYIQQDLKSNTFWLDYEEIWSFFERKFGYKYQQIKELTEVVMGEHYKLKEVTTNISPSFCSFLMGEHYKLKEVTTK